MIHLRRSATRTRTFQVSCEPSTRYVVRRGTSHLQLTRPHSDCSCSPITTSSSNSPIPRATSPTSWRTSQTCPSTRSGICTRRSLLRGVISRLGCFVSLVSPGTRACSLQLKLTFFDLACRLSDRNTKTCGFSSSSRPNSRSTPNHTVLHWLLAILYTVNLHELSRHRAICFLPQENPLSAREGASGPEVCIAGMLVGFSRLISRIQG